MLAFFSILAAQLDWGLAAWVPKVTPTQQCPASMQSKIIEIAQNQSTFLRMPVSMAYAGPARSGTGIHITCSFGHVAYPWSKAGDDAQALGIQRAFTALDICNVSDLVRLDCGHVNITRSECESQGCCFQRPAIPNKPWCFSPASTPIPGGKCDVERSKKIQCGFRGVTKKTCESSNCCWQSEKEDSGIPSCYGKAGAPPPYSPGPGRDHFLFGSFTKVWTAAAVLKLHNEGTLDLDERAFTYMEPAYQIATAGESLLSVFPDMIKNVTIRELLYMRASFKDYDEIGYQVKHPLHDLGPTETISRFGVGKMHKDWPVGSCGSYSSLGYVLVGLILLGVEGTAWDVYDQNVWREFFPKIGFGIHGTCASYTDIPGDCDLCRKLGKEAKDMSCSGGFTCGNMIAPTEEVARFVRALFSGELLGPNTTQEMLDFKRLGPEGATGKVKPSVCKSFDSGAFYGLGVEGWKTPHMPGHEGVTYGFTSMSKYDMSRKASYVAAIATSNKGMDIMVADAWRALHDNLLPPREVEDLMVLV